MTADPDDRTVRVARPGRPGYARTAHPTPHAAASAPAPSALPSAALPSAALPVRTGPLPLRTADPSPVRPARHPGRVASGEQPVLDGAEIALAGRRAARRRALAALAVAVALVTASVVLLIGLLATF